MPKHGSSRGYRATAYVTPLVLMLDGGGRSLEDMRTLKNDTALTRSAAHRPAAEYGRTG